MVSPSDAAARRIALFVHCDNDYQALLRVECVEAAERYGFGLRVYDAGNDARVQVEQIQGCLRDPPELRPHALLVHPVSEARLASVAHAAARAGVGWVLLGRRGSYMAELRRQFPSLAIFSVAPDQRQMGFVQGKQLRLLLPQGGEVLYVHGPHGTSSAAERLSGLEEVLRGSAIRMLPVRGDWTFESGARAMADWLQTFRGRRPSRFLVGAQNDAMAMGARSALEQASLRDRGLSVDDVQFAGCDGTAAYGRRLVTEGMLRSTVVMPPTTGRAVTELSRVLRDDRTRPEAQIVLLPTSFPTLETLEIAGRAGAS